MSMCVPYSIGSLSRPPPTPRPTVWEVQILNPYRVEKSHLKKHSEVHFFYLVRSLVAADAPIGEHAPYFGNPCHGDISKTFPFLLQEELINLSNILAQFDIVCV